MSAKAKPREQRLPWMRSRLRRLEDLEQRLQGFITGRHADRIMDVRIAIRKAEGRR